jgi:hypothetical protein
MMNQESETLQEELGWESHGTEAGALGIKYSLGLILRILLCRKGARIKDRLVPRQARHARVN